MSTRTPLRILAGLGGLLAAAAAVAGALWVVWIAVVIDDGYMTSPLDAGFETVVTGRQLVIDGLWGLAGAVVTGLLAAAAVVLARRAAGHGRARAVRLALLPAATSVAGAVALGIVGVSTYYARPLPCHGYRFDRSDWLNGGDHRADQISALERCGTLHGASPARVRALLGPPFGTGPAIAGRHWDYDGLTVVFDGHGRVLYATGATP
jgi:hypothetical protein